MSRVDDRLEILDLLGRYSHGADGTDPAAYAEVFTEDGVFIGRAGQPDEVCFEGRAAIERFMSAAIASRAGRQSRHHQASTRFVRLDGGGAVTRTYLLVTAILPNDESGQLRPLLSSVYEDELVRTAEGWRIAVRRTIPDVTGTLADRTKEQRAG